jgi:hypothetical protein
MRAFAPVLKLLLRSLLTFNPTISTYVSQGLKYGMSLLLQATSPRISSSPLRIRPTIVKRLHKTCCITLVRTSIVLILQKHVLTVPGCSAFTLFSARLIEAVASILPTTRHVSLVRLIDAGSLLAKKKIRVASDLRTIINRFVI